MADRFLLRRKGVALDVIGPVTAEEAKDIAGYPGEFEKLPVEGKPNMAGYDTNQDGSKKAKASDPAAPAGVEVASPAARSTATRRAATPRRRTATRSTSKASTATATPTSASTPASGGAGGGSTGTTSNEG